MKPLASTIAFLTLLVTAFNMAQAQSSPKNVARLCPGFVFANSVNGESGVEDSPFYGARNAFDGGQHLVNNINYSAWAPGQKSDWIQIRFANNTLPLKVEAIAVRADEAGYLPETMQATLTYQDGRRQQFPAVSMTNPLTSFPLPAAAESVSVVRLDFQAKQLFQITEIQVLGQPSPSCHVFEDMPYFDDQLKDQVIATRTAKAGANGAAQDAEVSTGLKEMAALHAQMESASNEQAKADAWLNLNRKADALAYRMSEIQSAVRNSGAATPSPKLQRIADKAKALGVPIGYCEIGDDWSAEPSGYANYLKLSPNGPSADEAYWKSKTEPSGCGDFEGSVEEYQQGIATYRDFIARYPASSFVKRAKDQLSGYEAGLREAQAQQAKPQPVNSPR
jgi:hypothetical protein